MRKHPAFSNINWIRLVRHDVEPPYAPGDSIVKNKKKPTNKDYKNNWKDKDQKDKKNNGSNSDLSFKEFIASIGKRRWLSYTPDSTDQTYFDKW